MIPPQRNKRPDTHPAGAARFAPQDPKACEHCARPLTALRRGERWCEECAYDIVREVRDEWVGLTTKFQRDGGVMIQAGTEGDLVFDSVSQAQRFLDHCLRALRRLGN